MRSTFKLLFYINRNKVKSDGTTAVLCRISIDGKKSAVTTGIYCKPEDWDSTKGEIRTTRETNRLATFRNRLEEAYGNLLRNCNLQIFLCLFLEKLNMPQNTPVTKVS